MKLISLTSLLAASAAGVSALHHIPPKRENITIIESKLPGISMSFRETTVCETTPGVKAYAGYIHLPPSPPYQDYQANMFFWFFSSRSDPLNDPLVAYFEGGPGSPSISSALMGIGPCMVNSDGNSTRLNQFSWNNNANVIFIDNPITTGYSYGDNHEVVPMLRNQSAAYFSPLDVVVGLSATIEYGNESLLDCCKPGQFYTFDGDYMLYQCGAMPSNEIANGPRSTRMAGVAIWNFFQAWFDLAPFYKHKKSPGLHFWGLSYGGKWAPGFADLFLDNNAKIRVGELEGTVIEVEGVGVMNGLVDAGTQNPTHLDFLYNNTFGVSYVNETFYESEKSVFQGCVPLQEKCNKVADELDPERYGLNEEVFAACQNASDCWNEAHIFPARLMSTNLSAGFPVDQRVENWLNFSSNSHDNEPYFFATFLSQGWVQRDMGVEMNFTADTLSKTSVVRAGLGADEALTNTTKSLIKLLHHGVRVTLAAGDYDAMLGWQSHELVALHTEYVSCAGVSFANSTWNELVTDEKPETVGLVREAGLLSLSRVFGGAHGVYIDQPGTIYNIFARAIDGKTIADGANLSTEAYITEGGLEDAFAWKYPRRGLGGHYCNLALIFGCSPEEYTAIAEGKAVIKDFWYDGTIGTE